MVKSRAVSTMKRNLGEYAKEAVITKVTNKDQVVGIFIPLGAIEEVDRNVIAGSLEFNPRHSIQQAVDAVIEVAED